MKHPDLFNPDLKKRKKPVLLTSRSRKYLERSGFIVANVERSLNVLKDKSNPFGARFINRFDAFSIADLIACKADVIGTTYVQSTDFGHAADHREKILAARAAPILLKAENRIELHLWKSYKKNGRKLWRLNVLRLCLSAQGPEFRDPEETWFYDNMQDYDDRF